MSGIYPLGNVTHCPVCGSPAVVQTTETGVDVQHVAVDPAVLTRAAEACRIVARSVAGGTSTTTRVAQLVADEEALRAAAALARGER
ncbi:MAG: hypothetical protein WC869_10450 [Phycisphaerae bacterium]|jgi:hypothetical protein